MYDAEENTSQGKTYLGSLFQRVHSMGAGATAEGAQITAAQEAESI